MNIAVRLPSSTPYKYIFFQVLLFAVFSLASCAPVTPSFADGVAEQLLVLRNFSQMVNSEVKKHLSPEDFARREDLMKNIEAKIYLAIAGLFGRIEDLEIDKRRGQEIIAVAKDIHDYVAKKNGLKEVPFIYSYFYLYFVSSLGTSEKIEYLDLIKKERRSILGHE